MEDTSEAGIRWNIAVDGSDMAEEAFNIVFHELHKEGDYIIVSHVYSKNKDYLPMKFKPENMKLDYEAKLIGTHSSKWTLQWEPIDKDLTTKEHITKAEIFPEIERPVFKPPLLKRYTDMQELLILDPIHEVDDTGWPAIKPDFSDFASIFLKNAFCFTNALVAV